MQWGAAECVRETLMAIARLTGELRGDAAVQVNIALSPEWHDLEDRIVVALRPFPEARTAVLAALETAK